MSTNPTRKHNLAVAYFLLHFINHDYDNGGISCGRSRESVLLEAVLYLLQPTEDAISDDLAKLELQSLLRIATDLVEKSDFSVDAVIKNDQLGSISDRAIGYFLLGYLEKLYQSDNSIVVRLSYRHLPIIRLALSLIAISFSARIQTKFDEESLLREVKNRQHIRCIQMFKTIP